MRTSRHTILAVDDEPASLRTIARTLGEDHHVLTASGGAQGLAILAAQPVALLIVDQRMPDMTGTEFLAASARQHPEAIRILLTGYTDLETLVDAINAGHVYHYLTKPWEPGELRLVVRRGLERHEAEAERRRLLSDLGNACTRLRREVERKTRLLAVAAHELGTPLHVLCNALDLMSATEDAAAAAEWLTTARRSAAWLGRGLAHMARAARAHTHPLQLQRGALDVRALLFALQQRCASVLVTRRLTLHIDIPLALPALLADGVWLERALANLLSNAIRFTPDGGHLRLAARADGAALGITVADTGVGIQESQLAEVFEPFSAAGGELDLHASGRFDFGARGLGLGLWITKAIIEQHGGRITVHSQPGVGSIFTVTLPLPNEGGAGQPGNELVSSADSGAHGR